MGKEKSGWPRDPTQDPLYPFKGHPIVKEAGDEPARPSSTQTYGGVKKVSMGQLKRNYRPNPVPGQLQGDEDDDE